MFLNGPCGEIAPCALDKTSGFELELGKKLGTAAVKLVKESHRTPITRFEDVSKEVPLPLRPELASESPLGNAEIAEEEKTFDGDLPLPDLKRAVERKRFLATLNFLKGKATSEKTQKIILGKLVLNDVSILAFPGETFCSTAEKAAKRGHDKKILTVTEHGPTTMYIVPKDEYHTGGYEATCCMLTEDAEDILLKAVETL